MIRQISRLGLRGVALLAVLGLGASPAQAANYWKNSVVAGNWSNGSNWSATSAAGVDDAGAPTAGEAVYIAFTDGTARTVTYDVAAPSIGLLYIDLTGSGTTTATLSLPSNFNLTNNGMIVGGSNSVAITNGRGVFTQSGGTVTTNPVVGDVVVGYGSGSSGIYNLSGGALVNNLDEYIGFSGTGTFNHSGGSNTINASASGFFSVGHNVGSTGTYSLSGSGTLATNASQNIGNSGTGTFNQTGGTNTISGAGHHLYIGRNTSGVGTYNLSGTAALTSGGDVIVGNNGAGTLTIQDLASVYVTNNLSIKSFSAVNLNGGTLRFNTVGGSAGLNQLFYTAGTIQLAGNRNFSSDTTIFNLFPSLMIPSGKKLVVEGNSTIEIAEVTVDGGEFVTNGALSVGAAFAGYLKVLNAGKVVAGGNASIGSSVTGINLVSGPGSSWTIGGDLTIGNGDLTIQNQGLVYVGGAVNFTNPVGSYEINLNGGTLRFSSYSDTGQLSYTAGTIQLSGDRNIGADAAVVGIFGNFFDGNQPTIPSGKQLTVEGTATIAASSRLTLSGGTLSAGTVLMSPGSRILSTLPAQVIGPLLALAGSTIDATGGNLTLGDATKVNGFYGNGTLLVGQRTVTLADANDAVLDSASLVTLGNAGSPGTLVAANGLTLDFGGNVTGFGTVDTPNNLAKPLINNGHITGNSVAQPLTLPGYVKGVGTFDNVNFTGTFAPGLSPTILTVGNVAFSSTSTLIMELGGTAPGSGHDQLLSSAALAFDGTLIVSLINGFIPQAGQSFNLFDWISTSGSFDALQLPALAGLAWNTSQLYATGELSLAAAGLPGDYNANGVVDAADYAVYRNLLGQSGAGLAADGNGNNQIDPGDYGVWRTHFGQTAGSGSDAVGTNAVPEPATVALFMMGLVIAGAITRRGHLLGLRFLVACRSLVWAASLAACLGRADIALAFTTIYPGPPSVPSVGGYLSASISGVNDAGTVVGVVGRANDDRPYRWNGSGAAPVALGHFSATGVVGINNSGTAVGYIDGGSPVHWESSGTSSANLALPPGWFGGFPGAVNDAGIIVGYGGVASGFLRAVRWTNSGAIATELGTVGAFDADASYSALAVNAVGIAVGQVRYSPMPGDIGSRPFRWDAAGTATQLGDLGSYPTSNIYDIDSSAYSINAVGTAVGQVLKNGGSALGYRAVRWDAGEVTATELGNLGTSASGAAINGARAINNAGTIAGRAEKYDPAGMLLGSRAVRWNSGQTAAIELGNLGTALSGTTTTDIGYARPMNAAGTIVGTAKKYDLAGNLLGDRAVYWGTSATAVDLNSLIDPASGWVLSRVSAISDTGWIAGNGLFDPDGAGGQVAYDRMFLLQLPQLTGDYNNNGGVDAADYAVWRNTLGQSVTLPNDSTPGSVTHADYDVWTAHFGQTAGSGSASALPLPLSHLNTDVPEPVSIILAVVSLMAAWPCRLARTRKSGLRLTHGIASA